MQHYLAEVIDECVFVERQRELMERRLTSHIAGQKTAMEGTLNALRLLCRYTHLLEGALLPGLLATLPIADPSRQDLLQARADADTHLRSFSPSLEKASNSSSSGGAGGSVSCLPPLAELTLSVGGAAAVTPATLSATADGVSALLRHKAHLLDTLSNATTRIADMQLSITGEGAELAGLRARMDELTRFVTSGVAAAPPGPAVPQAPPVQPPPLPPPAKTEVAVVRSPASSPAVRFAQARVLAYEKTAQALNNELALLHENYAALSRASAVEADRLRQKHAEAQRRHEEQVAECDAVLGRLSLELEQLIRENAQLKQKMRAATDTTE